jgi:hypothetical protein
MELPSESVIGTELHASANENATMKETILYVKQREAQTA